MAYNKAERSGDAENRNPDRRNNKTYHGVNNISSRHLTQMHRKNKIARAEEHTEKRSRNKYFLLKTKFIRIH